MIRDERMNASGNAAARSPRSVPRLMALGFVWLGWLLVILGPLIGLVVMASPIPGIRAALLPAIGVFAADAFCVVFGELCVAVFDIADRSTGSKG